MAEEINQQLGFNAGNTFSTLANLEAAFNKFASSLNNVARRTKGFNTAANRTRSSMSKLGNQSKKLLVSWETLSRVIQTQVLVRSLNVVRNAFEFAYRSQLEFTRSVSEIKTIDPGRTYQQIANDVRVMSEAFNQPVLVVAEAQYQTLSDQFTSTTDRINILTAANQLAKATEDDLVGATQLLTGALNAYGESSEQAGLRAAQFFEAINLGRFRASELGTALGRIQTLGHEVGTSMEELQSGLIAITIGGVKATEAATQMRGIFTALLKPSKEMKKAFKELGVESGEAAIRTFGFLGALEKIKGTTDGSSQAMSQLFRRVRGAAGALRLLSEGTDSYNEAMEKLIAIDQRVLATKSMEVLRTDAARLQAELNKLKNFFTVDLGSEVVKVLGNLISLLGGGAGLVGVLKMATAEVPALILGIGALHLATVRWGRSVDMVWAKWSGGSTLGLRQFAKFRNAFLLLIGIEFARVIGKGIGQAIENNIITPMLKERKALEDLIELNKLKTSAAIREAQHENKEKIKLLRQYTAEASKSFVEDKSNFQDAMKIMQSSATRAFDNILGSYKKLTGDIKRLSVQMARESVEGFRTADQLEQQIADNKTIANINRFRNERIQASHFQSEMNSAASKAARLQRTALDDVQQGLADAAWDRVDAYRQLYLTAVNQSGNLVLQRQSEDDINGVLQKRADSIRQQAKLRQQASKELENQASTSEKHYAELNRDVDVLKEKLAHFAKDEAGVSVLKRPEEALKDLDEYDRLVQDFVAKINKYAKGDFLRDYMGDVKVFEDMRRDAERMLAGVFLKEIQIAPQSMAKMWDDLQASADQLRIEVPILAKIEAFTGMNIIRDGLDPVFTAFEEKMATSVAQGVAAGMHRVNYDESAKNYARAMEKISATAFPGVTPSVTDLFDPQWKEAVQGAQRDIVNFIQSIKRIKTEGKLSNDALFKLGQTAEELNKKGTFKKAGFGTAFKQEIMTALDAVKKLQIAKEGLETSNVNPAEQQKVDLFRRQLEALQQQKSATDQIKGATSQIPSAINQQIAAIDSAASATIGLISAWNSVTRAINQATAAAYRVPTGTVTAFSGGKISNFDSGGAARGVDTIPAMLSKGEFVMNPQSTRQWYSQLVAMNSGGKPNFKSEGGSTTSAGIIGDVSINVNSNSGGQVGRDVVKAINREIRRGSSRIRQ